jgi:hypothetical protein
MAALRRGVNMRTRTKAVVAAGAAALVLCVVAVFLTIASRARRGQRPGDGFAVSSLIRYGMAQHRLRQADLERGSAGRYAESLEELRGIPRSELVPESILIDRVIAATSPANSVMGYYFAFGTHVPAPGEASAEAMPPLFAVPTRRTVLGFWTYVMTADRMVLFKETGGRLPESLPDDPTAGGWRIAGGE